MKKNKIIFLSILGLLLFIPFMMPATAAPAAYVGVAEEEYYDYTMSFNWADWTTSGFLTDGVSDTLAAIFGIPAGWSPEEMYNAWSGFYGVYTFSWWSTTVGTVLPENQSTFLSDYFIFDNITHTPVNLETAYWYYAPGLVYLPDSPGTYIIVNDSASFALQSLYGGLGFSPMTLKYTVPFAPNNTNWATFAAWAQWGMDNYWSAVSPLTTNITVSALADGYSMYIPTAGLVNNTAPITVNVTYTSMGALNKTTFEYGSSLLYAFELNTYYTDAVDPVVTSPSDLNVAFDYTGQSISWTATDANAGNYTITRDATPVVTTTPWVSGVPVVYNITDGLAPGASYTFEIIFTDNFSNSISDSVVMTVTSPDATDPDITMAPSDLVVEFGATGQSLSWTATDANAGTYTITLNGTDVVVTTTPWVSGTPVTYNLPNYLNLVPGVTTYEITFSDISGNTVSDSATITVGPIPTIAPPPPGIPGFEPLIIIGITGIASISWIALKKKKK